MSNHISTTSLRCLQQQSNHISNQLSDHEVPSSITLQSRNHISNQISTASLRCLQHISNQLSDHEVPSSKTSLQHDSHMSNRISHHLSMQFYGEYGLKSAKDGFDFYKEFDEFKLKSNKKPESTFIIIKNFIDPFLCDCDELENYFKEHPEPISQNEINDNKRMHLQFKNHLKLENFKGFVEIDNAVENFIKNNLLTDEDEVFNKFCSVLLSLEDCPKQEDYDDSEEAKDNTKNSFIILIALNDNTKLDAVRYNKKLKNESRPIRYSINLNSGDMFLARRGTFLHDGSDYVEKNFRIHYYVNCKDYESQQNNTNLLRKSDFKNIQPYAYYDFYESALKNLKKCNEQKNKKKKFNFN
jgi:hypothetical protein